MKILMSDEIKSWMMTELKIFVKLIAYSLAGNFAVCRFMPESNSYVCEDHWDNEKRCSIVMCKSASITESDAIFPSGFLSQETCVLQLNITRNTTLAINEADEFKRFRRLQSLHFILHRSPKIYGKLPNSTGIDLSKNLKLDNFSLEYGEFNRKNNSWILPATIEYLHLSNSVFEFILHNCSRLTSLRLNNNELNKIPPFCDLLPSLEKLDLRNNSLDELTVLDIANLCKLEHLAMNFDQFTGCECKRLKLWIRAQAERPEFFFEGRSNCSEGVGALWNCTLAEAWKRREKCEDHLDIPSTSIKTLFFLILSALFFCVPCLLGGCVYYLFSLIYAWVKGPESQSLQ